MENSKLNPPTGGQNSKLDSSLNPLQAGKIISSSGNARSMADLMASFSSKIVSLKKGDIIEGTIKKLTPQEITMDIGAKSDALVLEFDKKNVENLMRFLKPGERVKASVLSAESEEGFPVVSLRRALDDLIFLKYEDFYKNGQVLDVHIFEATRGGFFAETSEGIRGFLPNSQVVDDSNLVGKTIKVKIIEFERIKKRIIFSEKAVIYLINASEIEKKVKKDEIIEAKITNVVNHGIYVSLTRDNVLMEGFIHISEVSYDRVEDLGSMYKKDSVVKARVLDIDYDNRRINLSIKRLEKDVYDTARETYKVDQKLEGVVEKTIGKGVVVNLENGISGFIPDSKVPSGVSFKIGEKIQSLVENFDDKRRVVILSPVLKEKPIAYR